MKKNSSVRCGKEEIMNQSLLNFFQIKKNYSEMIPILKEESEVSLRLLDWFITNYSKENTKLIMEDPLFVEFNVYNSYKAQLKAFNKKLFDPFCRLHGERKFVFHYDEDKEVVTTVAQLNFFKWAIDNHIITYVKKNLDAVKESLKQREKTKRSSSSSNSSSAEETSSTGSPTLEKKNFVITFD